MTRNISTRLLYAFVALEEARHFTRAAERCHTSQPAFSAMIRKLEEAAGTRLFERDTRNVTLTPEGELFSEVARTLLADIESAFDDMADYVARKRGRVSIAALPSLAARALPAVIAHYRRLYPGVAVTLHDALSDGCLALLRQRKADLVLTAPGANFTEFDARVLGSDPFYLVCRRDHPLAKKRRIRPRELAGQEIIHLAKSSSVRQHVDVLLRDSGTLHSGFEVEHLATVAGLVEQGLGVSLVPELTLFQFRLLDLAAIPLAPGEQTRPILLVTRKDETLSIAAQGMLELIKAQIKPAGAGRSDRRR